jgi:WD40 repeat protein
MLRVWNLKTETVAGQWELIHRNAINGLTLSPDGKTLGSSGANASVHLLDITTGVVRRLPEGHTASVEHLAFSPDGRLLATAGEDATVRLWDVVTGGERATLKAHTESVRAVAFSPDGRVLVSGGMDRTLCVHRSASPEEVAEQTRQEGAALLRFFENQYPDRVRQQLQENEAYSPRVRRAALELLDRSP